MSGALIAGAATTFPHLIAVTPGTSIPIAGSGGSIYGGSGGVSTSPITSAGVNVASLVGIFVDAIGLIIQLFLVGVVVIVVVSNRADPDPSGRRPQSIYFFAISFVTVLLSVIGSTSVVVALTQLIGTHVTPIGNDVAKVAVLGGLLTVISLILLLTHLRRGLGLALADQTPAGPSRRLGQTYVSAVTFLMVLLLLFAAVFAIYLVFALAGPGVFGSFGGRDPALRYLIDAVFVAVVAFLVISTHRSLLPPGLSVFGPAPKAGPPPGSYPTGGPPTGPSGPPTGGFPPSGPTGQPPTGQPPAGQPTARLLPPGFGPAAPPGQTAGQYPPVGQPVQPPPPGSHLPDLRQG
ncbi:MAG TPA: hypothetical protein VEJ87_00425 [Acidimicrobiales bacterium]|nr:hypothetical protein [Acidimicrobiales bacterium]